MANNQTAFFRQLVIEMAAEKILNSSSTRDTVATLSRSVADRDIDPYSAAEKLIKSFIK
jgi:hypothetical protein